MEELFHCSMQELNQELVAASSKLSYIESALASDTINVSYKAILCQIYCDVKARYDDIDRVLQIRSIGFELPE